MCGVPQNGAVAPVGGLAHGLPLGGDMRALMRGLLPVLVLLVGCQGTFSDPAPWRPGDDRIRGEFYAPEVNIRRLTREQIQNAVGEVFGDDVTVSLPEDVDAVPESFTSIQASQATVTRRSAELYEESALGVAQQVIANADRYPELVDCAPDPTASCARDAIARFGQPLFRRPLEDGELDRFSQIVEAGGDTLEARQMGLEYALAGLLIAPSFLYLHHRGEDVGDGVRRFDDHELAERLAFFLWDSIPDEELLRAAADGELSSADGVEAQVRRMLVDERADDLATRFFSEAWRVNHLDGGSKSAAVFPDWNDTVAELYRTEFDLTLRNLVMEQNEDLRNLFTGETTWANAELGALYGIEVEGDEWREVPLPPERHGLLTSGAVMAANANPNRTSPTHRGLFVLSQFLCGETPEPPEGIDLTIEGGDELTGRQVVEMHLEEEYCAGCHQAFDPLGLTFEAFDAAGAYRTEELGQPIDTSAEVDGQLLAGSRDLAELFVEDSRVPACIARNLYGFAVGTRASAEQIPLTAALGGHLTRSDWSFTELVVALATSDEFRLYREASEDDQ